MKVQQLMSLYLNMFAKQIICALVALQFIAAVVSQYAFPIDASNVTTDADDYILENRRHYNATLKSDLDQIDSLKNSLENELKVLEKQKGRLLDTIQKTYEKIEPLEVLSLPSKFCVQRYRAELPYLNTIKANIESCISTARSYISSIISTPTSYYTLLSNYYYIDFKNALNACGKSFKNPSLNYTLCVTTVISNVNTYTNTHRDNFATAIQSSECTLNSRIDVAVSCTYTYYNSALASIGAVTRLIDDCIKGYLENKPQCGNNNETVIASCPNVIKLELMESDFQNETISNPLQGFAKNQTCVELRFV